MEQALLPDWISRFVVPDQLYEEACAALTWKEKSCLKKCIAALHTWYEHTRYLCTWTRTDFSQGLQAWQQKSPRDWVLIRLDPNLTSPPLVLATILPPVLAGVREVIICRDESSGPYPAPLLTALELSGQETVVLCSGQAEEALRRELSLQSKNGAVCSLSESAWGQTHSATNLGPSSIPEYFLRGPTTGGVWIDAPGEWDFEVLRFAHPNLKISLWSEKTWPLPVSWPLHTGSIEDLKQQDYDVLFMPQARLASGFGPTPLIFGPGQEGSFVWPGFCLEICFSSRIGWWDLPASENHQAES